MTRFRPIVVGLTLVGCMIAVPSGSAGPVLSATARSAMVVTVPDVVGIDVSTAYADLHRLGVRVSVTKSFQLGAAPRVVASIAPAAGRSVGSGTVVWLSLRCLCGRRTDTPRARRATYRVPDFHGDRVSSPLRWAAARGIPFTARLGLLDAGNAPSLLENYRVNDQTPPPRGSSRRVTRLLVVGAQPASARMLGRCALPAAAMIQGQDSEAVVYSVATGPRTSSLYGCLLSIGAAQPLGSSWSGSSGFASIVLAALAGHEAALVEASAQEASGSTGLLVADLASGRQTAVNPGCVDPSACMPDEVVINPSGFIAWHLAQAMSSLPLTGIACPSVVLCVAVDGYGDILSSTDPAGGPSAWTTTALQVAGFTGISCASPSLCVAIDGQGGALVSTDPTGGAAAWSTATIDPGHELTAISCTPGLCAAGDQAGQIITSTDPTGGPATWSAARIDATRGLTGVSCPSVDLCIAVDGTAAILSSSDPTGGPAGWSVTPIAGLPASDNSLSLTAASCSSVAFCAASGMQLDPIGASPPAGGRAAIATNPTGGSSAWSTTAVPTTLTHPAGISCPSLTLCVVTDAVNDVITSTDPTASQASWSLGRLPSNGGSAGIACAAASLCDAVDNQGHVSTATDPAAGASAWISNTVDTPDCGSAATQCAVEQLYAHDDGGTRLVDHTNGGTTGTALSNLTLTGNTLTWTHNSAPEAASLG